MKPACRLHDRVNLWALPILGLYALAGLLGWADPTKVTNMFLMYIVADLVWVWIEPDALPSIPNVIIAHHIFTFALLLFPLTFPDYANFTCWDGITELNTFFLIARRQWRSQFKLLNICYWATFVPFRLILYPYLLLHFYFVMIPFPWYWRTLVVFCQAFLCCFNYSMFAASLARRVKKQPRLASLGSSNITGSCGDLKYYGKARVTIKAQTA